ncbi:alpha-N-acetylglucosaminidase [Pedobacter sp. ISL-68]|uniref:alpha-N-acetylglucosaminidase n=1 Tax=unclassified Pedobacter TaxID=2628915 RepID=UPI001BE6FE1C|nr:MULTISPECIES: alpha-N-acetylglucosaminidase [unclassified Pedobacter]MBT2563126.1 alpha-N-acetylglucosaminidase [Pedobacter sp. ISL-64]MBT2593464.1 alpha-N-acetylglucosaminidase [Pedobacter sp. ISL-68]
MNRFFFRTGALTLILFICTAFNTLFAQTFDHIRAIAQRRVAWLAPSIVFRKIPEENGKDVFELLTKNNKIEIAASGPNAAAEGLGWYLKYYCHRSMSHIGDHLEAISTLPVVKGKVRIVSPYPYRYALNYCTISYSMSFYTWEDWERELDWMALNGVNLVLAPVGMEAVWQKTLKKLGFTDQEALAFIPGPAFGAWWLMGNMEGWGGPMSQHMINGLADLEKKIISRMKEIGIQPVMHGFYGMVPTTLKSKMDIKVVAQGKWVGGFTRPDFLRTDQPAFKQIADVYYSEMKKLYGADLHYFGGDPFHEGGTAKGIDLKASGKSIQDVMLGNYPGSTWVLQGWQSNPDTTMLSGLDKKKVLIIELFGENTNNWEKRKGYEGTQFIWSNVSNFGEKNGLYGKLQRFSDEVYRAKSGPYGNYLKGVGIIPEGINNNPVTFDLMLELGWHKDHINVEDWIKTYVQYRYGKSNTVIEKAWAILLKTVYSSPEIYQEGPSESIFCARPAIGIKTVSSWGTRKRNYDTSEFLEAVRLFASASKDFEGIETYQADRIDLVRQVQANKGDQVYQSMMEAIKEKDLEKFRKNSAVFTGMIKQQDVLLSNSRFFTLNRWLKQAERFGTNAEDKAIALKNSKAQITYWGPDTNARTDLHEYAHKEWAGLLGSLYLARWKAFEQEQLEKLAGNTVQKPDYFKMETSWVNAAGRYEPEKLTETQLRLLIDGLLK